MPRQYYRVNTLEQLHPQALSQANYPCKIILDLQKKNIQGDSPYSPRLLQEKLEDSGFHIIGVDEAGRGPVAGPVTAAACLLPTKQGNDDKIEYILSQLDDSKRLTERSRSDLYPQMRELSIAYGIAEASPREIDELNILNATFLAMRQAIQQVLNQMEEKRLPRLPILILVDGNQKIRGLDSESWKLSQIPIIQGDGWISCISAASILAKHHRDLKMNQLSQLYPHYDLSQNKGYPSRNHIEMIRQHGRSEIHRKSFHIKSLDEMNLFS